jgi:hypothetical protein
MESNKLAKQILAGFADTRLITSHLAWEVQFRATPHIDKALKEFFYFYTVYRTQNHDDPAWDGEKMLDQLTNPTYGELSVPPPPGTRIVFADEI